VNTFNEDALLQFATDLSRRLHEGAKVYGNRSFSADPAVLFREIREELVDVSAWSFILSERLRAIETALAALPRPVTKAAPLVVIRRPARQVETTLDDGANPGEVAP
jgi:hypothetical protein